MGKAMNDFAVIGHHDETLGILIEAAGPGIADEALSTKDSTERVPTVGVVVAAQLADRLIVPIDPRLRRKKWQWLATKVQGLQRSPFQTEEGITADTAVYLYLSDPNKLLRFTPGDPCVPLHQL